MTRWRIACLTVVMGAVVALPAAAQPTATEIVARSVQAHGGDALSSWQTLTITGTVLMQDGIAYNGAYTLYAKAPDRLRVEHDATADRGRAFYEYFLNGGVAWSRRNLVPGALDVDRIQRWLDQCYGIAFYAHPGVTLELKPDADLAWPPDTAATTPATSPTLARRVWVIAATVGTESRELCIDQETHRFLKEATPQGTRVYWDFKSFNGMVMPTRILEITKGRQGDVLTPFTWTAVKRNVPIEDWRFTEDKPAVVR
jgi:hypothetical protein